MAINTSAKSMVSIGPATACKTEAEFKALASWAAITNIEDVGEFSSEMPVAIGKYVDADFVRKLAGGPRDSGDVKMVFGYDPDDDGQTALKAANLTTDAYAFKITLNDAPAGAGSTPSTFYFMAIVSAANVSFGNSTDPIKLNATLAIDGGVIEVAAATA